MPTARELYDFERTREFKNIPLLKSLKAQIEEQNVVSAQLAEIKKAKSQEEWGTYEKLQQQLAPLTQQTYPTHPISTAVNPGPGLVNTVVVQAISPVGSLRNPCLFG